jgi:hypothetical protein
MAGTKRLQNENAGQSLLGAAGIERNENYSSRIFKFRGATNTQLSLMSYCVNQTKITLTVFIGGLVRQKPYNQEAPTKPTKQGNCHDRSVDLEKSTRRPRRATKRP